MLRSSDAAFSVEVERPGGPTTMIRVRPIEGGDLPWVVRRLEDAFGDVNVARKGVPIGKDG